MRFYGGYSLQINVVLFLCVSHATGETPAPARPLVPQSSLRPQLQWIHRMILTRDIKSAPETDPKPRSDPKITIVWPPYAHGSLGFCVHFHLFHITNQKKHISETFALRPAPGPGSWREFGPCRYQDTLKYQCLSGWWLTYPSEKYEFVSWDHYSQYMESHKIHVPNHQPVIDIFCGLRSSVPSDFPCPKTLKARPGMRRQLPNTFTSDRNPRSSRSCRVFGNLVVLMLESLANTAPFTLSVDIYVYVYSINCLMLMY